MSNKEIITELVKRYQEPKKNGIIGIDSELSREAWRIFLEVNGKQYSITRQALADEVGDEFANAIWLWIR